jgi:hypothetical protein
MTLAAAKVPHMAACIARPPTAPAIDLHPLPDGKLGADLVARAHLRGRGIPMAKGVWVRGWDETYGDAAWGAALAVMGEPAT